MVCSSRITIVRKIFVSIILNAFSCFFVKVFAKEVFITAFTSNYYQYFIHYFGSWFPVAWYHYVLDIQCVPELTQNVCFVFTVRFPKNISSCNLKIVTSSFYIKSMCATFDRHVTLYIFFQMASIIFIAQNYDRSFWRKYYHDGISRTLLLFYR